MGLLATLRKSLFSLTLGYSLGIGTLVQASPVDTAPPELTNNLTQIESAANQQDLDKLLQFYSPDFENSDGLRHETLAQALSRLFADYERLNYTITLDSWQQEGEQLVVETITTITGSRREASRFLQMTSTIRSREYWQDSQIVRQEILSENTEITAGANPPKVQIIAPEKVLVQERFNFDVIVEEPIGDEILLGAAIEEQTRSDRYLEPSTFELQPLSSGGIFKWVTAPSLAGPHWLSAIVIRSDGLIMITRRVRIEEVDKQS